MEYTVDWISLGNIKDIKKYLEVRNTFPDTILGIRKCCKEAVDLANYDLGIYIPDSPEYEELDQACWEVAHDGDSYPIKVPRMRAQEVKVMEIVETILNLPEKIEDVFNS